MIEDYTSIFDLNLPEILKSFKSENFANTSSLFGTKKRHVDLFENEFACVLWFDWSYEGFAEIFVRLKQPKTEITKYKNDIYYPLFQKGSMSSCGDVKTYSCENPWEKILKNVKIYRNNDDMFVDYLQFINCLFFKKVYNEQRIDEELNYKYCDINDEIKTFVSMYEVKTTGMKIITTCNSYGKYKLNVWSVDSSDNIIEYKIVKNLVYRDGGTTYRTLEDNNGHEHMFFSPSRLNNDNKISTFDDLELYEITDKETINSTLKSLNILTLSE